MAGSFTTTQLSNLQVGGHDPATGNTQQVLQVSSDATLEIDGDILMPESTSTPAGGSNIASSQLYIEVGALTSNLHFLDASGNTIYTWASSSTEAL